MKNFLKDLFHKNKTIIIYYFISLSIIILSYLVYLFFSEDTVMKIGREDDLFEYMTALSFLVASILFLVIFIRQRKIIPLVFAFIFFVGMGEEVSWGQRIFNYKSPEYFRENNIQNEFNLHNLSVFDSKEEGGNYKKGISYYLSMNFLYKLFWLTYGILLPLAYAVFKSVRIIASKIYLPVPPFILGSLFLINWFICRLILSFFLPEGRMAQYYYTAGEIREFGSALIFMILGAYFLQITIVEKRWISHDMQYYWSVKHGH